MTMVYRERLAEMDMTETRAFEMHRYNKDGEEECFAYITSDKQWQEFVEEHKKAIIYICKVDKHQNTAIIFVHDPK